MAQYISKDALVAKITDLKLKLNWALEDFSGAKEIAYDNVLDAIYGLEVKEVSLDTEIYKYMDEHFRVYDDGNQTLQNKDKHTLFGRVDAEDIAKYFFELGLNIQKEK